MIWYLVDSDIMGGCENMEVDLALMDLAKERPILRFYQWNPPALSLGKFQKIEEIDEIYIQKMGFDLVRRPSGGRAVLHYDELTYSVLISEGLVSRSILKTYLMISKALVAGFSHLGLISEISKDRKENYMRFPACFATTSMHEITIDGRKLVGSAQVRREGIVLQHGSIPLKSHIDEYVNCFLVENKRELVQKLMSSTTAVYNHLDVNVDEIKKALVKGFKEAFNVEFENFKPDLDIEKYNKEVKVWD